jgi:hypothetical protein
MTINDWVKACLEDPSTRGVLADWLEEREDPRHHLLRFVPHLLALTPPAPFPPRLECRWWWEKVPRKWYFNHGWTRETTQYRDNSRDWPALPAPAWPRPDNPRTPDYYRRCWKPYLPLYRLLKVAICRATGLLRGFEKKVIDAWLVREELMACVLADYSGQEGSYYWDDAYDGPLVRRGRPYLLARAPKSCRNLLEIIQFPHVEDGADWRLANLQQRAMHREYCIGLVNTFNDNAPWEACRQVRSQWRFAPGNGRVMKRKKDEKGLRR